MGPLDLLGLVSGLLLLPHLDSFKKGVVVRRCNLHAVYHVAESTLPLPLSEYDHERAGGKGYRE